MNRKQYRILVAIYERPPRSDLAWRDVETMLRALGATVEEGRGSRVRIVLNGVRAVFHRPHPERVTDRGQVTSVRIFLERASISPENVHES